jgi:hypothetical protein
MLWSLIGLTLATAPVQQGIAVTRFRLVQVDKELGGYAEDRLAKRLSDRGFKVSTPADLETILGLERQRQLLGCTDDTSCLAEISGALGVELVVTGRLTRLGKRLELDFRVVRQKDAGVAATVTRGTDDESQLGTLLEECAESIADQLLPKPPSKPVSWRLWGPVVAGAAAVIGGGVLVGTAQSEYGQWTSAGTNPGTLHNAEIGGKISGLNAERTSGFVLLGLGAALVATGIAWNALTPAAPIEVSAGVVPGGAGVSVGGRF